LNEEQQKEYLESLDVFMENTVATFRVLEARINDGVKRINNRLEILEIEMQKIMLELKK